MTTITRTLGAVLLLMSLLIFTQCKKDNDESSGLPTKGTVQFDITDGPMDAPNVEGVYVTVASVQVDGQDLKGFSKETIDLLALRNGETKSLGYLRLEGGNYSNVTLVLDFAKDEDGNAPGCYVLTADGTKHNLQSSTETILEIKPKNNGILVENGRTTNVVLDVDLRKIIRSEDTPQGNDRFDFVTGTEINNAVRLVTKNEAGSLKGVCVDSLDLAGEAIIVYAYTKGSFNKSVETTGQGESNIQFKHAITSAMLDANGDFTLAFLEAGDYELHFFGYEDANHDGEMEIKGELDLDQSAGNGFDVYQINLKANSSWIFSVGVMGLIP